MIVQSSDACEVLAAALLAWIEAGPTAWLSLYTNDVPLTPDVENPGSYVEASYPGYARIATLTTWTGPFRANPGIYYVQSGPWTFNVNTGAPIIPVFGWFLQRGTRVVYAERFDGAPLSVPFGLPGPTLLVQLTQASQSVICPPT